MLRIYRILPFFVCCVGCTPVHPAANETGTNSNQASPPTTANMNITIGDNTFSATLNDSPAALAFKAQLPLSLNMVELNGNEKYADLPKALPTAATNPRTIQNGDLMLYGASTLVLFYKSFSTVYTYTSLGRVDDPTGLAAALGAGNVIVRFEME